MRNKVLSSIVAFAMVLAMLPVNVLAVESCLKVSGNTLKAGESVTVTYMVPKAVNDVSAISVKIGFDKSAFEATSAEYQPISGTTPVASNVNEINTAGEIGATWVDDDGEMNIAAGTVLLTVVFKVKDTAAAGSKGFEVEDSDFTDVIGDPVDAGTIANESVSVVVVSELSTVTPSIAAPVKGATPQASVADADEYTGGNIMWTPSAAAFGADTAYKATATLTAKTGCKFASDVAVTVEGASVTVDSKSGDSLTFTATFPKTASAAALSGTVTVTGTPAFGETLTANTSTLDYNGETAGTLSYQWKRDGVDIPGATSGTYTLTADDVDKTISVAVTSSGNSGNITSAATGTVAKQAYTGAAPSIAETGKAANSVTVTSDEAWEYSKDNGASWQDSNTFTGLEPATAYSIIARVKATATTEASGNSAPVSITTDKAAAPSPVTPVVTDKTDTTITVNPVAGQKYMIKPASAPAPTAADGGWSDSANFDGLSANTAYRVYTYIPESDTVLASAIVHTEQRTDKTALTDALVPVTELTHTFDAATHTPTFGGELTKGTDYTVRYTVKTGASGTLQEDEPYGAGTYTVTVSATDTGNYTGSFTKELTIAPANVTVTPDSGKTKAYGESDPALTYTTNLTGAAETAFQSSVSGALSRDAGENVGTYHITIGTLEAGANFSMTLNATPVTMSITAKNVTETRAATSASIVVGIGAFTEPSFGEVTGTLAYDYDGATTYDAVKAKLAALDADSTGTVGYTYTASGNYTGTISGTINFTIVNKADADVSVTADKTVTYGDAAFTVSGNVTNAGEGTGAWTWSVASGTSAAVDAATGEVTIENVGVTVIKGHYESDTTVGEDTLTVTVNKKPVTITGLTAADKTYDGTTTAAVNGTPAIEKVGSDDVSVTAGTAAFSDKNVGKDKTVTFSGYALSGADKDKYELTAQPTATATITTAALTPVVTAVDRAYNETNTVELAAGVQNVFGGDDVSLDLAKATGTMADADVGEGKAVTVTGVALTGADAGNYVLSGQPAGVTVTISKAAAKQLTVNATQKLDVEQFRYDVSKDVPATAGAVSAYAANGDPVNTATTTMTGLAVSGAGIVTATVTSSAEGDVVALPLRVTAKNYDCEIILNVKIVPKTHTVTFNANNGKGSMPEQTVEDGVATKLSANAFTRSGYSFSGWNTKADGRGTAYANRASVTLNGNLTLYAQWSVNSSGGGSSSSSSGSSSTGSGSTQTPTTKPTVNIGWDSCKHDSGCLLHQYTDVKPTEWYHDGVHYCLEKGLMVGTGANTFAPNAAVSRAQLVTILWRMENSPASGSGNFSDVATGSWYAQAVNWASANNIVGGYGDGSFGPDDSITREQFAAIMYRYARYKGYDTSKSANLKGYADNGKVSGWASTAMGWANAAGLITGTTGAALDPNGAATRAQTAAIIQRFCVNIANK